MNLDYWLKSDRALFTDLLWHIPEQKTGTLQVIGGNVNNFVNAVKQTEFLSSLPIREVRLLLPDSLRSKIPPVVGVNFAPSTDSGSFATSAELKAAVDSADLTLLTGDFSKNSITAIALASAIQSSVKPVILARDTIDLVVNSAEDFMEKENLTIILTMVQLQKLLRNLLYPKMILLSSPLLPVVEILHKFTLSYPATIFTFHQGHIIIAESGKVVTIDINNTNYSPIGLFVDNLASKIAALQLFNPSQKFEATQSALFWYN